MSSGPRHDDRGVASTRSPYLVCSQGAETTRGDRDGCWRHRPRTPGHRPTSPIRSLDSPEPPLLSPPSVMPSTRSLHEHKQDRPADPVAAVATATERLYTAFAAVAFDPLMAHSPGSVTPTDLTGLGAPVATLDPELVARFLVKAGTTWGGPDDIRRVAPRALELAADHQLPIDRGLLWAKLRWAGWPGWPTYQVVTVRAFLRAEWGRLLRSDPRPAHLAHRWLRHAAYAVGDLDPFLEDWHDALGPLTPPAHHRAATGHLVVLLINSALRPDHPQTADDLFPGRPDAAAQLTGWLTGPGTRHELQRAAVTLADTSDSRRVEVALERLQRFRTAVACAAGEPEAPLEPTSEVGPRRPRRGRRRPSTP